MARKERVDFVLDAQDKTARAFNTVKAKIGGLTSGFNGLKIAIAGIGLGALLGKAISVSREFEILRASLKTVTGSAEAGAAAFQQIQEFAATTPFSLQQATEAYIRLKSLGLDPTKEAMTSFGNTAAAMGKDLIQFVEAIADATTGEFERLKEFGIKARSEGENVAFTFQGVTTTVKKNADEIEAYLRGIGDLQFAGAMAERAQTLDGALSNLSDSTAVLFDKMGQGGLAGGVSAVARAFSDLNGKSQAAAGEFGRLIGILLTGFAEHIPGAMTTFTEYLKFVVNFWTEGFQKLIDMLGWFADKLANLPLVGEQFREWADSLNATSLSIENFQTKFEGTGETIADTSGKIHVISEVINNNLTPALDGAAESASKTDKQLASLAQRIKGQVETPMESLNKELADLDLLLEKGLITWEEYGRAMEQAWDKAGKATETANDNAEKTGDVWEEVSRRSGDALEDLARRGGDSFDDMKRRGVEALIAIIQKMYELKSIENSTSGSSGGGIFGSIFKFAAGSLFGSSPISTGYGGGGDSFDPSGRFATGGSFRVGGAGGTDSQVVRFRASPDETVTVETPAQRRARGSGGGGTTFIYHIDARGAEQGVEQKIRAVLRSEEPRMRQDFLDASASEAGQGGGYAKAMGRRR